MSGPGMSLDMRVGQRLEQRQVLSLQTIQSLKILQLATTELQQLVEQELLENPTLDALEEPLDAEPAPETPDLPEDAHPETDDRFEDVLEYLERHTDSNDFVSRSEAPGAGDEEDAKSEAFNNVASPSRGLHEHLLEQLRLRNYDELDWPLLEHLAYSLDPRGYLAYPLDDAVRALDGRYTIEEAQWALGEIQKCEPRGVGARNLAECLLLQINAGDPDYQHLKLLLTEYWEDVLRNRLPRIARALGLNLEEVKMLVEFLGTLNPQPGSLYSEAPTQTVVPDVVVEEDENGAWVVRLTREMVPRLAINPMYARMLQEKGQDKQTMAFLRSKMTQARALIEAIDQRQSTLERVSRAILARQPEFIRGGMQFLRPMKMQDIADELGIHHSTVWRAVYGKYMQTPQGVFAMNELFTGGLPAGDSDVSREAVKLKVKEIIDGEDRRKPLSDLAIARKLDELGIQASRRVVTKYREELGLADSRVRKAH